MNQEIIKNYPQSEIELFNLLKKIVPDLTPTKPFCHQDCYSLSLNTTFELKCRTKHYDMMLIEEHKLLNLRKSGFKRTRYICSSPMGIWSFDSTNNEPIQKEMKWLKDTTYFGPGKLLLKPVGYYHILGPASKDLTYLISK